MNYVCTILTPAAHKAVSKFVDGVLSEDGLDDKPFAKSFKRMEYWTWFCMMWNGNGDSLKDYLESLKDNDDVDQDMLQLLLNPTTTEQEFEAQERGYQSQPRITWNGEIVKIDAVEAIISYKRAVAVPV